MILKIFLLILFVILISLLFYFVINIFVPAVKSQAVKNADVVFSDFETNFIFRKSENKLNSENKRAVVLFTRNEKMDEKRLSYKGVKNCVLYHSVYGTPSGNVHECIGYGDCIKVCPQHAIKMKNGAAIVTNMCCGCGRCISVCPVKIIEMIPRNQKSVKFYSDEGENAETHIIEIPEKKYFKFWKTCYRIVFRGISKK